MIFFHNIYKTSCPQQELTFGGNAQLWQKLQEKTFITKDVLKIPTGLTFVVHIPNLLSPSGIASVGTKLLPQPSGPQNGGKKSRQCYQWEVGEWGKGRRTFQHQPRSTSAFVQSFRVHARSCNGIISHLWKHNVISVVKFKFLFFFFLFVCF